MSAPASNARRMLTGWLISHTRALLPWLGVSVVAAVVGPLLSVAMFVLAARLFARIATGGPAQLSTVLLALVVLALAKAALRYLEHYAGHWVAFTALQRLRELFFARLIPRTPASTRGRAGGDLTERATRDIDRIEVFFAHTLPPVVAAVAVPSITLVWLGLSVSWTLTGVLAPFVVVSLLVPALSARGSWSAAQAVADERGRLATRLTDDIQGVREVLAFGAEQSRADGLRRQDQVLVGLRSRLGFRQGSRAGADRLLHTGSLLAVIIAGDASGASLGQVLVTLAVAAALWAPTAGIDDFFEGLDAAFAATARVREVVEQPVLVHDPASPVPARGDGMRLRRVSFGYRPDVPVLRQVDLSFPAGTWSHLVGVSGSGKSTIADLLLRGWDPSSGEVLLGRTSLRDLRLDEVRRRVTLVQQRPVLIRGTIADNLRLANPSASDEELWQALRLADLDDWVDSREDGLQAPMLHGADTISGGQLQRLALARGLLAEAEVLILDEALSQLDQVTADTIRGRIAEHRPQLTVIEITHRADVIDDAARVAVLDQGQVLEQGSAGQLRARAGAFAHLERRAS